MESTKKKEQIHTNRGDFGWRVEQSEKQAQRGRWTTVGLRFVEEERRAFLIDVFKDLYGKDSRTNEEIQIIYVQSSGNGDDISVCEYPRKDEPHVYYNRHFFIELIPSEWKWSESGEEFFEQQLKNVQLITSVETSSRKRKKARMERMRKETREGVSYKKRRSIRGGGRIWNGERVRIWKEKEHRKTLSKEILKHIDECVDMWKDKGIIVKPSYFESYISPRVCQYCGKEINLSNPSEFLIDVFYALYRDNQETKEAQENPFGDKPHVYYDTYYYIELIPNEWEWSTVGEGFFEQQLKNVKSIPHSETKSLDKEIEEMEENWKDNGFIVVPLLEEEKRFIPKYSSKGFKKREMGRYPEYCDGHKSRQRRVRRHFETLQKKNIIPPEWNFDEMGMFGLDIERLLRPRCAYCGGVIPDDKKLDSQFCSVKCKDAFKYRLSKERKTHPDITPEELIEILEKERIGGRRRDFWIRVLKEYLKTGGDPFDESFESVAFELRSYFQEEYPSIVARVREEIEKEKLEK